jgi:hypothetical protein
LRDARRRVIRDHPTDAAARVGNVAVATRNNVNMGVRHGLACGDPIVEPDVKAIGLQTGK